MAQHWVSTNEAVFYQMPSRFWELAVGGLVAMLPTSKVRTALLRLALLGASVWLDRPSPALARLYPPTDPSTDKRLFADTV